MRWLTVAIPVSYIVEGKRRICKWEIGLQREWKWVWVTRVWWSTDSRDQWVRGSLEPIWSASVKNQVLKGTHYVLRYNTYKRRRMSTRSCWAVLVITKYGWYRWIWLGSWGTRGTRTTSLMVTETSGGSPLYNTAQKKRSRHQSANMKLVR